MFKRNEYGILNRMLDDAISGSFEESRFDESELSKLQSKLMRYLSSASMSERKLQEEKSRIEELITNISHQTKTPLTNIMMYSELLCETTKDEMASKYAEEIHVQSKKLDELIKALVKMSRLETGIFQLQREATSLMKVARNAAAPVVPAAKEKDIRLIIDETRDTEVLLDLKWTTEAICNILDNAVKYSEEGTEITIGCYKTSEKEVLLPITEVVTKNEFFDYDAKYNGQVEEITPARISEDWARRVREITSHIYDILHCNGIIRIDYIISKDGKIRMLEVNTTPGMTPTSFIPQQVKAAGLTMTEVLTDIVENQF